VPVYIYAPLRTNKVPEHRTQVEIKEWLRSEPQWLPFHEMWRDLQEVLTKRKKFNTLRGNSQFTAEFLNDQQKVRIRTATTSRVFRRNEIQELWQELRDHQVLTKRTLAERERELSYLMPILRALPYVDTVEIADSYNKLEFNPTWALQLVPYSRSQSPVQHELAVTV
jgi:hypothetical protein